MTLYQRYIPARYINPIGLSLGQTNAPVCDGDPHWKKTVVEDDDPKGEADTMTLDRAFGNGGGQKA